MKRCMIVWVPLDILYNLNEDDPFSFRNKLSENLTNSNLYRDIFETIDEEFVENSINN